MFTPLPRHRLRKLVFRTFRHRPDAVRRCFFLVIFRENNCILLAHSHSLSSIPSSRPPSLLLARSLFRDHTLLPSRLPSLSFALGLASSRSPAHTHTPFFLSICHATAAGGVSRDQVPMHSHTHIQRTSWARILT
jgi:hypothetical protein